MQIKDTINYKDFAKLDLRVGEIKKVEDIKGADKLYKILVDVGGEDNIQILSGIRKSFTKEELVGKQIIVLVNLEPRKMKGEISNGMLLAVGDEKNVNLLRPKNIAKAGEQVL